LRPFAVRTEASFRLAARPSGLFPWQKHHRGFGRLMPPNGAVEGASYWGSRHLAAEPTCVGTSISVGLPKQGTSPVVDRFQPLPALAKPTGGAGWAAALASLHPRLSNRTALRDVPLRGLASSARPDVPFRVRWPTRPDSAHFVRCGIKMGLRPSGRLLSVILNPLPPSSPTVLLFLAIDAVGASLRLSQALAITAFHHD